MVGNLAFFFSWNQLFEALGFCRVGLAICWILRIFHVALSAWDSEIGTSFAAFIFATNAVMDDNWCRSLVLNDIHCLDGCFWALVERFAYDEPVLEFEI
jgi:hypothetical protein